MKTTLLFYLNVCLMTLLLLGCQKNTQTSNDKDFMSSKEEEYLDSIVLSSVNSVDDTARVFDVIDSLEYVGGLSRVGSDYFKGEVYDKILELHPAEYYWRRAVSSDIKEEYDRYHYIQAANSLAALLLTRSHDQGVLRLITPVLKEMEESQAEPDRIQAQFYSYLGTSQLRLGMIKDANSNFERCFRIYLNKTKEKDPEELVNAMDCSLNIVVAIMNGKLYEEAEKWTNRCDSFLTVYKTLPETDKPLVETYVAYIELLRSVIVHHNGQYVKAALHFMNFQKTHYSKTLEGRLNGCEYLMVAKRYNEAADIYEDLDSIMKIMTIDYSLDNISQFVLTKYRANLKAGRKGKALEVASKIVEEFDSALIRYKISDAGELAILYDVEKKNSEIARQKVDMAEQDASMMRLSLILISGILILILIFYIVYTSFRRKADKRLSEMEAEKTLIENELGIAREIQMSMVPSTFPVVDGLDMYAKMTPAKEVGGDLYGYVLQDEKLYFCVGDVSGKGVPASLFMAQATSLFRSLSAQGLLPSEILRHMNDTLSGEDNVNGMFVTLFLAKVDLRTGHLCFSNAGHNPPVYGANGVYQYLEVEPNVPVGLFPGVDFVDEEIESIKGKTFFIYTDGLNEAENRELDQFGEDRLLAVLKEADTLSSEQLISKMHDTVELHRDGADPNDDLTMMCLKI